MYPKGSLRCRALHRRAGARLRVPQCDRGVVGFSLPDGLGVTPFPSPDFSGVAPQSLLCTPDSMSASAFQRAQLTNVPLRPLDLVLSPSGKDKQEQLGVARPNPSKEDSVCSEWVVTGNQPTGSGGRPCLWVAPLRVSELKLGQEDVSKKECPCGPWSTGRARMVSVLGAVPRGARRAPCVGTRHLRGAEPRQGESRPLAMWARGTRGGCRGHPRGVGTSEARVLCVQGRPRAPGKKPTG